MGGENLNFGLKADAQHQLLAQNSETSYRKVTWFPRFEVHPSPFRRLALRKFGSMM
jgi:hypothetical protein